ncbi:YfbM family protein [Dactylosporangium sp. NPDC051541]|uniref:YfbM family protein n=1 Tax=Dactylosporangium sp. NPDC051541 TaxID=3363977 RepID=UPI0037BAFE12
MSMNGNYLRLAPLEIERARKDPDWAMEYSDDLEDAELEAPDSPDGKLAVERLHRTDRLWDVLRFLLERAGCPVGIVYGEEEFTEADWGYGPARLLTVERVQLAAEFLAALPYDQLVAGVTVADLAAADLYPGFDTPDADSVFEYLRRYYDDLVEYFRITAAAGDGLVVWLS